MSAADKQSRTERDALDASAMARIVAGDAVDGALAELYDRHAPFVFGVALKIVRDPTEAEDVVHDAFIAIVERADQFRPERGSLVAWLVTTVRNLSLDRARRRTRRAKITDEELRHEPMEPVLDPEAMTWLEHRRRIVIAALESVPEAQRRTLEIAFFEGLTYPEIAEREGVPLGTVKSRAARALAALRAALEGAPDAPNAPSSPDMPSAPGRPGHARADALITSSVALDGPGPGNARSEDPTEPRSTR